MKKELLYGIIGLLVGAVLTGFFATYAVNNNRSGMMGIMGMSSNSMMNDNMDRNFIEQMIPHHESAIAMARLAQQKSTHSEIKILADDIISSQSGEINTMRQWYKDWYGSDVSKLTNTDMSAGSMMSSQTGLDALSNAADFDKVFLSQMISHHQMAVMMANMLDIATNRPEMKKLADDIIVAQTKEINDMKSWQQQWGYESSSSNSSNMIHMMGH